MGTILDILAGNDPGASPWGALYPFSPVTQPPAPLVTGQAPDATSAAAYGAMGVDPSQLASLAPVNPFPAQQPQSAPTPPATGFGAGAAPFSFAGPGSNVVSPSQIADAPAPAAPAAAAAPSPPSAPAAPAAPAVEQASPIAVGNYQMPRIGAADDFEPDETPTDVSAQSRAAPAPAAPQPAPFSLGGAGDRLALAGKGFLGNMAAGPVGALLGGVGALVTGKPTDAASIAKQNGTATAQALIAKGAAPADVAAAVNNPALMAALIQQYYGKDKFKVVQTGEDGMGRKTYSLFNESDGTIKPLGGAAAGASGAGAEGLVDTTKTGAAYLATLPQAQRGIVTGMLDGTIQPPTSFAAAKPYWQAMLAAAKQADPTFDENNWAARHKMSVDLASSGNSSMGGILSNGESSFKHLAEYTQSVADQGNASHDFPLGGMIAHGQNYIGNTFGGSATQGKTKAVNDNLGHYGQESTKFYAGTGGGVEERMNALHEMNATTTSGEEAAAYAEKEKGLMLDRLNSKLREIRDTFGEEQGNRIIAKHLPDIQASVARIDANIARLRGQPAPAQPQAGNAVPPPGNYVWTPGGGLVGAK